MEWDIQSYVSQVLHTLGRERMDKHLASIAELILKGHFGIFKSTKKEWISSVLGVNLHW